MDIRDTILEYGVFGKIPVEYRKYNPVEIFQIMLSKKHESRVCKRVPQVYEADSKQIIQNNLDMKQTTILEFKYWLRIHGYRLKWFGTGTKNNPIKIKSREKRNK